MNASPGFARPAERRDDTARGGPTPQPMAYAEAPGHAPGQPTTLREVLTTVFRDRWRIGSVLLGGLVLTAIAASLAPKNYTAEASLLLRLGREYVYTPEVGDPGTGSPVAYDREQTLLAESKILTSRDLKETVIRKMGAATVFPSLGGAVGSPEQHNAAVLSFERALDAELLKGSNLMQVSFVHPDAAMSAKVLAELIDAYLQKRSVIFASAHRDTAEADFVARKAQLDAAEDKLSGLKTARRIRAFGEEQTLLLAQRNALESRQADSAFALAQANGRVSSLRSSLKGVSGDVTLSTETQRSEAIENARKLMLDLKLKERDLSAKFSDSTPAVQDVRSDLQLTAEFLRDLESRPLRIVKTGRSPTRDVVESDLLRTMADQQQARAGAKAVSAQRAAAHTRLAEFSGIERELQSQERERRIAEANYDAAAKRLRDETALAELDRKRKSNVSVVQSPLVPLKAKSTRGVIVMAGTAMSVFAALLMAFLSALLRDTYLTPAQIERGLGVPLLAAVPKGKR